MPRYFGSPAAVAPAAPVVFTVTAAPQGAWPWGDAFYFNGYTYVAFTNNAGGARVAVFSHTTGIVTQSTITVDGTWVPADQHNRPAILRRSSDDRMVTVFCGHSSPNIWVRVSVNPLTTDPTISGGWQTATNIDSQLLGTQYTYPRLFEFGTDIMLFYRDFDGVSNWEISTHAVDSSDLSTGWSSLTNLFWGVRYYSLACQPSSTRLDFFVASGSYAADRASLYHFYRTGTSYKKSDGTAMPGSPPFDIADMTLVYDGSTAGVRAPAACLNDGSEIAVVFPVQTGTPGPIIGQDEDYIYCRATVGSATWTNKTVATAVGGLTVDYTEGSLAIDLADIDHLIVSKRAVSSLSYPFHLYDYLTADAGTSWTVSGISVSGDPDMYPVYVLGYQPELEYVWLKGTFTSSTVFNDGIQGYGTPP